MKRVRTIQRANVTSLHNQREAFAVGKEIDRALCKRTKATKNAGWDIRRINSCYECKRKFWGTKRNKSGRHCPDCLKERTGLVFGETHRYLTPIEEEELKRYYKAHGVTITTIEDEL